MYLTMHRHVALCTNIMNHIKSMHPKKNRMLILTTVRLPLVAIINYLYHIQSLNSPFT